MAYLLLANILLLIELTIKCSWIWIHVSTPMLPWITLRLPIPIIPMKLKTGESFVEVPMPPTVHTGFIGWLTAGSGIELISHDGDRPGHPGEPFPVRLWIAFFVIVAYPILLMDFLLRVFRTLLRLLALVAMTLIMWSMWIGGDIGDFVVRGRYWGLCIVDIVNMVL